jgi:hypothetical protein
VEYNRAMCHEGMKQGWNDFQTDSLPFMATGQLPFGRRLVTYAELTGKAEEGPSAARR